MKTERLKLLIIEDDEEDVLIIEGMLSGMPAPRPSLRWVSEYEEGLRLLLGEPFDACLLDYRLGPRNGLELLRDAIEAGCKTPIILLTGKGDYEVDLEAMRAGASDYLMKGQISPDLLERSIRFGIERKRTETELRKAREKLQSRVAELAKTNETLRREEARLEALLELNRDLADSTIEEMVGFVLARQVELTGSRIGFFGLIDQERKFHLHSLSRGVEEQCWVSDRERIVHAPIDEAGVWAEAARTGEPIIVNRYSSPRSSKGGLPEGHVPIERFMAVPATNGKTRVEAVAVLANKEGDYDGSDLRQALLFMQALWKLVERRRAAEALREAETLAALGRALSAVAHDIKTPLVAIGGLTKLVHRHMAHASPDREKLDIVLKETERLESMVRDILFFARPVRLDSGPGDIGAVLEECVAVVDPAAQKRRVSILKRLHHPACRVEFDSRRLKQVIINLLTNAVEASAEGQEVVLHSRQRGEELIIEVVDRGPGIPREHRPRIFLPFFTTKKSGTGLGLSIAKKITEGHRGRIEALDNFPRGAIIRITLPGPRKGLGGDGAAASECLEEISGGRGTPAAVGHQDADSVL